MKKLSILLALLLVAAVVFGAVTMGQKGDLQKQADELTAKLTAAVSDKDAALKQADELKTQLDAAAADKTALEEQITGLTAEKDDAEARLTAAAAELDEKAAAAAAVASEKDAALTDLAKAAETAADLEGQVAALTKLFNADYAGKTVILHTNDVHGAVEGYACIPTLRNYFSKMGAEKVLTVDAGDFSQGTDCLSATKGLAAVEMMNAAGYNLVTLGNHEFDFGYEQLMENLSKADFYAICCNVLLETTGQSILNPAMVVKFVPKDNPNGDPYLTVGFVGVATPEIAADVNPDLVKDIRFSTTDELYATVQKAVDAMRDEVNLVIGLCHLGVDGESAANGCSSYDLLSNVTGIDFVIDGHSHTAMTQGENGEPIQSAGTAFANIGVVVIDNETRKVCDNFLVSTALIARDEAVAAKAQEIMSASDAE